jgi:hypothetical protein
MLLHVFLFFPPYSSTDHLCITMIVIIMCLRFMRLCPDGESAHDFYVRLAMPLSFSDNWTCGISNLFSRLSSRSNSSRKYEIDFRDIKDASRIRKSVHVSISKNVRVHTIRSHDAPFTLNHLYRPIYQTRLNGVKGL